MSNIKFLILGMLFVSLVTTTGCEKKDKDIVKDPVENNDDNNTSDEDNDNSGDNTSDNDQDSDEDNDNDDNDQDANYPYISEVALFIFDGDDPLSDGEPVYTFLNKAKVFLNPATSCQMVIKQYEDISAGNISGAWGLELLTKDINLYRDNKCFNESFVISGTDLERETLAKWHVELLPPDGSPYKILDFVDGEVKVYEDISTKEWAGSQGSINVTPSQATYTDPRYGVFPKKVTFTFDNVRVGYSDKNNVKKAVRIVGVIEITKHD